MAVRILLCAVFALAVNAQDAESSAALWGDIKSQLTKPDGHEWFELHMKDAIVPGRGDGVVGAVVSSEPANRPRTLIVAVRGGSTPDAKLRLEGPLQNPIRKGAVIVFEGHAVDYTLEPFMLSFDMVRLSGRSTNRDRKGAAQSPAVRPSPKPAR